MSEKNNLDVFESIVCSRRSVRGFTSQQVDQALLDQIFTVASWAPSNCNTQPWHVHVVSGDKAESLKSGFVDAMNNGEFSMDYPYLGQYQGVQKERQYDAANQLYTAMGIAREDKVARHEAFLNNFRFFGAPHAAFIFIKDGDLREAADVGMYAQNLMLALRAAGLASCPQTALSFHCDLVRSALGVSEEFKLLFGISFGYEDESAAANQAKVGRAELSDTTTFHF